MNLDNSLYAFLAFGLSFVYMLSTRVAPLFVLFNKIVTFEKKKVGFSKQDQQKGHPSGWGLVVGGLGWVEDPDILGSIPTKSFSKLSDTQF